MQRQTKTSTLHSYLRMHRPWWSIPLLLLTLLLACKTGEESPPAATLTKMEKVRQDTMPKTEQTTTLQQKPPTKTTATKYFHVSPTVDSIRFETIVKKYGENIEYQSFQKSNNGNIVLLTLKDTGEQRILFFDADQNVINDYPYTASNPYVKGIEKSRNTGSFHHVGNFTIGHPSKEEVARYVPEKLAKYIPDEFTVQAISFASGAAKNPNYICINQRIDVLPPEEILEYVSYPGMSDFIVLDGKTGEELWRYEGFPAMVYNYDISGDGRYLALAHQQTVDAPGYMPDSLNYGDFVGCVTIFDIYKDCIVYKDCAVGGGEYLVGSRGNIISFSRHDDEGKSYGYMILNSIICDKRKIKIKENSVEWVTKDDALWIKNKKTHETYTIEEFFECEPIDCP